MTLKIAQLGQPVLRQKTQEVSRDEILSPDFQTFIDDLLATVTEKGGIGLAGPQVFCSKRLFVAGVHPPPEEGALPALEVFINPKFTAVSEDLLLGWEGCLSFEELLVLVPRAQSITVEFLDRRAEMRTLELADFAARVVQHEYDHLDGILTIDRAPSPRYIIKASEREAAQAELEAMLKEEPREDER